MSLGTNLYQLRREKNMSQGDLADALGVSRQSVSKWETDAATPELDKLMKLSELFHVTLDELVKGEGVNPVQPGSAPAEGPSAKSGISPETPLSAMSGTDPAQSRQNDHSTAAAVFLCMAVGVAMLFTFMGGLSVGLLFGSPFLICGIVCLLVKRRRTVLVCLWALFLLGDAYLDYATGIRASTVRLTFRWTADMNYFILAMSWVWLFITLAMAAGTALTLRKEPMKEECRPGKYAAAAIAAVLLCLPFSDWSFSWFRERGLLFPWRVIRILAADIRLLLVTWLLSAFCRRRRSYRMP